MTATGRAFVAVVPPKPVLDAVDAALAGVRDAVPDARWMTREQWHITVQFLGNHVDLDAVAGELGSLAVAGGTARLGGGGAFPTARRARVLWVGVTSGADLLTRLVDGVGALLAPLGYERDSRPHHAHLTVARLKAPSDLGTVIAGLDSAALGPSWLVDEVVLFRSRTHRDGADYEPLARISLASGTVPEDRGAAPIL